MDPPLYSDEGYVDAMQLWNCLKGWCEQQSFVRISSKKTVNEFRRTTSTKGGSDRTLPIESEIELVQQLSKSRFDRALPIDSEVELVQISGKT